MQRLLWGISACIGLAGCLGGTASPAASDEASPGVVQPADPQASAQTAPVLATPAAPVTESPNAIAASPVMNYRQVPFKNPVSDNRADPGIVRVGQTYYVFATNRGDGNVPAASSPDMVNWTQSPNDALPTLPGWASGGWTWAPEVQAVDANRFVMYFTARHTASGRQCVGTAVATTPLGPYVPTAGDPLACQLNLGGTIDPSPFLDQDGVHYVVYKNDGNCCGILTQIWLQRLAIDGVTPVGSATALLAHDQGWEGNLIEAPFVFLHSGTYYLFYSANNYANDSYAMGYATSTAIGGPYQKIAGPWVGSSNQQGQVLGPGGQNLINDEKGNTFLVYHTWLNTSYNDRVLNLAPITWSTTGPQADVRFGIDEAGPQIIVQ